MTAFFSEEGVPMSFPAWMMYGMPFVPVGALAVRSTGTLFLYAFQTNPF